MVSHFQSSVFDSLYCEEERFDEGLGGGFGWEGAGIVGFGEIYESPSSFLSGSDLFWEDDEVVSLLCKEKNQVQSICDEFSSDGFFQMGRCEEIRWMLKVTAHYGFSAMTALLGVSYFDRFISCPCFQKDKPWMSHLAAVACLSIAAKVEETQVPLLLDLQVEESKYFFEAKTVLRGELLVLSTLQWKVNIVTPLSFIDHIVRRFGLTTKLHPDFFLRCESLLLVVITEFRLVNCLPSVVAAATMIYVIREIDPFSAVEHENQLMAVLKTVKVKVDECQKLIVESMDGHRSQLSRKRRREFLRRSPSGVIDAYYNSDISNDSWATASSGSSSPEPLFQMSKHQEQLLGLRHC